MPGAIDECDTVVALLDGPLVDDGTAREIGYAYARQKRIIGIRTDLRRAGECEGACTNAMIEHACEGVARSKEELLEILSMKESRKPSADVPTATRAGSGIDRVRLFNLSSKDKSR